MLDRIAICLFLLEHPDFNVWPERPESGIDHEALPDLSGSPLAMFFRPYHREPPLPPPPEWFVEATPLWFVLAWLLIPVLWIIMLFIGHGEKLWEEARNKPEPPIPEVTWEEITQLLIEEGAREDD